MAALNGRMLLSAKFLMKDFCADCFAIQEWENLHFQGSNVAFVVSYLSFTGPSFFTACSYVAS